MERYREVPEINRLIIFPRHLREGLEFAKNQGYYDILINVGSTTSCKHRLNVSLICEYDFIESLTILGYDYTIEPCNLNQLSVLPHLHKLGLWADKVFTIDFSLFPKLEELKYYHTKHTINIDTLINLKQLHIYNFNSKELEELKNMVSLENLTLWDAKNTNLNGLHQLTNLRNIEIVRSKKLSNLDGLCKADKLESIQIYSCNSLNDLRALKDIPKLKQLSIEKCKQLNDLSQLAPNHSIEAIYISILKDLDFVKTMYNLKKLAFDDVISGDLSPLFESESLESVSMESKKKYGYSEGEVNKMLIRNKDCNKTDKIQKRKVAYFGEIDIKPSEEEIDCEVILDKKKIYLALNLFDGVPEYDWLNEYEDYASNLLQYKKAIDDYIVRDYDSNGKAKEYIDFHVEELDKSSINKILKKTESDTTIEKRLLSVLKLERVGFYPGDDDYAVWDYTIGKNVTDRLIVVVTDNNGNIKEITTES